MRLVRTALKKERFPRVVDSLPRLSLVLFLIVFPPAAVLCARTGAAISVYLTGTAIYGLISVAVARALQLIWEGKPVVKWRRPASTGSAEDLAALSRGLRFEPPAAHRLRHDVRGGLQIVSGFADLLGMEQFGQLNDVQRRYLACLRRGVKELSSIVDGNGSRPESKEEESSENPAGERTHSS